jgi:hypothetical protein
MIRDGKNGFVVQSRNPQQYAAAVRRAAGLRTARSVSLEIAAKYSVEHLADDLGRIWHPLATGPHTAESIGRPIRKVA